MTSQPGTLSFNSDLLEQRLAAESHSRRASVTVSTTCDEMVCKLWLFAT